MSIVKFTHGGKEYTFTEDTAITDLANLMCKELFGMTFYELSSRLINFTFTYNGEECYFNPSFVVKHLKQDQMKADVKNLIEDLGQLAEIFGFDECPQCNVVYPGGKVEHCRKCGYTPEGLSEMKRKMMAGEPVEMPEQQEVEVEVEDNKEDAPNDRKQDVADKLAEMRSKMQASDPVDLPSEEVEVDDEADTDGLGVRTEGAPAESSDEAGGDVQEPGVVPGQDMAAHRPPTDQEVGTG